MVLITVFFPVNLQNLFEAAATDFIAGIGATPLVLAHLRKDLPSLLPSFHIVA